MKKDIVSIVALVCLIIGLESYGTTAFFGIILAIIDLIKGDPFETHTLSKIALWKGAGLIVVCVVVMIIAGTA